MNVEFQTQAKKHEKATKQEFKTCKKVFNCRQESQDHSAASQLRRKYNPREETVESCREGVFSSFFLSFLAFFPKLEEAVVSVGQDTGLYASRTGIQMRAENPSGHPGESASSGDKDLENRNTRGGAWSRDFRPWISSLSLSIMSRLVETSLENQDWS